MNEIKYSNCLKYKGTEMKIRYNTLKETLLAMIVSINATHLSLCINHAAMPLATHKLVQQKCTASVV